MNERTSIFDFLFRQTLPFNGERYDKIVKESNLHLITPLKVIAFLVIISGLFAMLFEVRYHADFALEVYITRLSATLVAFLILVMMYTKLASRASIIFVHILLLTIIISSGFMILLLPATLVFNSHIVGLMIFTSAMFLNWEVKNQILVVIYYNIVFAVAILFNDQRIYFLPNMFESVLFVLFLSLISVIGSAINFRLRLQLAEKGYRIELSELKFRTIFNNISEGIFQSTLDGKFLTVNPAFAKMLGYSYPPDLMKKNMKQIVTNLVERDKLINILNERGKATDFRLTFIKKDGEEIVTSLNVLKLRDEIKEHYYFEANVTDVSKQLAAENERKRAENSLRKEKEKSDRLAQEALKLSGLKTKFLANMSHEIRTPMNGIIGFLSLIENDIYENKDELKQYVGTAKQSAESLLEIINSILDLSKIESGRIELDRLSFNFKKIIEQSISIVQAKASEKGLNVVTHLPPDDDLNFVGDPTRIRQIFINLLSNAVKFTSEGEITIEIKTEPVTLNRVKILTSIIDTGIGIPADKINELFKPFSQVDGSESGKFGGTGLGLVICKEFVSMMNGDIRCESVEGHGSRFSFEIIVNKSLDLPGMQLDASQKSSYVQNNLNEDDNSIIKLNYDKRRNFRLLLAEDNLINQKVILKILSSAGFNAKSVINGSDALSEYSKDHYDLILMDIQMPEMDGLEVTAHIRKMDAPKRNVPIIAITAHALIGDREKCLRAGMDEYISKPIKSTELLKLIDKLLMVDSVPDKKVTENVETNNNNSMLLNLIRLRKVSLGDTSFENELLKDYIVDTRSKLEQMLKVLEDKNLKKLSELAHTLKGSSYTVGASQVGDESLGIELSAKNNDIDNCNDRIVNLKSVIEATEAEILSYLNGQG
ncbi:MAG: ATP-binding protein [Ignavibacteriaceae bacterium]